MYKVLVFGRGKLYEQKKDYVKKNFDIVAFLDNMVKDVDMIRDDNDADILVCNPQKVGQYLEDGIKILLMSYQYVAMWMQLKELGVSGKNILFGVMLPPQTENDYLLFGDERRLAVEDDSVVYYVNAHERIVVDSHSQIQKMEKKILREKFRKEHPMIDFIAQMDVNPVSRKFGLERGKAIDRYYIEHFLEENKRYIHGDCLEIAENTYTLQYGKGAVENAYILHVKGWGENAIKGNLETGEGIEENKYDCAIITQTLMYICDVKRAAENIYKMLKKGGSALITVSGISQISRYDADLWGYYYSFHKDSVKKLFELLFGKENVEVKSYGNVKIAMALLYGLCYEDLQENDFAENDEDYPVIISAVLKKR